MSDTPERTNPPRRPPSLGDVRPGVADTPAVPPVEHRYRSAPRQRTEPPPLPTPPPPAPSRADPQFSTAYSPGQADGYAPSQAGNVASAYPGYEPRMQPSYEPPPPQAEPDFNGPKAIYWSESGDGKAPRRRGRGILRKLAFAVVALVGLLSVGVAYLLVAPPTGLVRDRLAAEVKARTGRDLVIGGEARLSFLPTLGVTLKDVSLSAPAGMAGPPLIRADSLEVQMALMPLITRDVKIDRLVLRKPTVELRVDANGRRSWDFADTTGLRNPAHPQYAQVNQRGPDGRPLPRELQDFAKNAQDKRTSRSRLAGVNGLSLGDVRISDGTLRYTDARQSGPIEVRGIDGRLSLKDLSGPLTIEGSFVLGAERVTVDAKLQSLKDALDEQPSRIDVKLGAPALDAGYEGQISGGGPLALDGRIVFKTPSLDQLARMLQVPVAGLGELGAIAIEGQLKTGGTTYALNQASFAAGDIAAKGQIAVELAGARPLIKPNLRFASLDLNRLMAIEPRIAMPAAAPAAATGGKPGGATARSIEDLIEQTEPGGKQKGPAVRGFTKRANEGWSQEPLNPALLRLVDIEGRIDFGSLAWANMKLGATQSQVELRGGVLKLDVPQAALYGGLARAKISVDTREPEISIGANISGDGLAAQAFLKDLADLDIFEGRGRLFVAVSAKGGSERELIGTLAGKAELRTMDGALLGWDANQLIGGLSQGRVPKLDRQPGAKTPFTEMSGSFRIEHGVARTQDLKVESPALRASGTGVVNIVDRNLNFVMKPQAKGQPSGGLASIEVPVRIAGPFDKVTVVPDVGGALRSQPAQDVLRDAGAKLKNGDVDGAAKRLLGNDPKADEKIGKAKERLQRFLSR